MSESSSIRLLHYEEICPVCNYSRSEMAVCKCGKLANHKSQRLADVKAGMTLAATIALNGAILEPKTVDWGVRHRIHDDIIAKREALTIQDLP